MATTATASTSIKPAKKAKKSMLWRQQRGLNRDTFARLANLSERSVHTYESGGTVSTSVRRQCREAQRLIEALSGIMPEHEIRTWLQRRNPAFGNKSPQAILSEGKGDLLWAMIHQTRQAAYA
jgi:transcriptional regulator with XRE-family HTH domain